MSEPAESAEVHEWAVESGRPRLDAFVIAQLPASEHSRGEVQGWISDGRVRVARPDGDLRPIFKRAHKLRPGDRVEVEIPPPPPPPGPLEPEDLPVPILYQDEAILVIDKPAGLTVHPGAGQRTGTLANALLHLSPGQLSGVGGSERPGIVHRLDKDTSGVLVVARSDRAHRELSRQFHDRIVRKVYLALTSGVPREPEGTLSWPLGRHPKERKKMAVVPEGRASETGYAVRETFPLPRGLFGRARGPREGALIECRPRTGRTHQIRVHLQQLGTPILADATYGRSERVAVGAVALTRHALHAHRLSFVHPLSGEEVAFSAPLPADMQGLLDALREADGDG